MAGWRGGGVALVSGSSCPNSSPGRGHCVVFLGKTLHCEDVIAGSEKNPFGLGHLTKLFKLLPQI